MMEQSLAKAADKWCQESSVWRAEGRRCSVVVGLDGHGPPVPAVCEHGFFVAVNKTNLFTAIQRCKLLFIKFSHLASREQNGKMPTPWLAQLATPPFSLHIQLATGSVELKSKVSMRVHTHTQQFTHLFTLWACSSTVTVSFLLTFRCLWSNNPEAVDNKVFLCILYWPTDMKDTSSWSASSWATLHVSQGDVCKSKNNRLKRRTSLNILTKCV